MNSFFAPDFVGLNNCMLKWCHVVRWYLKFNLLVILTNRFMLINLVYHILKFTFSESVSRYFNNDSMAINLNKLVLNHLNRFRLVLCVYKSKGYHLRQWKNILLISRLSKDSIWRQENITIRHHHCRPI